MSMEPGKAQVLAVVVAVDAELAAAERSLVEVKAVSIAATLVRPVRWEAEIFGFRTVSLDIRQNTTVTNRVLQEIWHKMNPLAKMAVPKEGSPEWTAWIDAERAR
ncbi:MAG: phosphoenolpyruvate carboxylase [Sphingopyxis sp.]|nr:phosphoenolpyruvate carboxylase [Sphingopyxis sp.]